MREQLYHTLLLIKRLGIIVLLYTICRILFYLFNIAYFNDIGFFFFLAGIRFDLVAIIISNSLFIILCLLPFHFINNTGYKRLLKILFLTTNGLALLANCIDFEYFKYTLKRTTSDVFNLMGLGDDIITLLPQFIKDFWYIIALWILLVVLAEYLYRKTQIKRKNESVKNYYYLKSSIVFSICIALSLLIFRGGFQLKPISIITASQYASTKNIPLVLNTPFTILKTLEADKLENVTYFKEADLLKLYNPVKKPLNKGAEFKKINVVLIIMESFSKEYIGSLSNKKTYTPFLDSLISESLVFTNAFANGKKSMEGLPAILASLPTLMNNPYSSSSYSGNQMTSFATILKEKGYKTSIFHGGSNGTMGFDAFSKMAGIENYYGRNEYGNEKDYDGNWGIFDEPFFQYFAHHLDKTREPFFSCFFSLSSHHPYTIPERHRLKFNDGKLKIHPSIMYGDYALRKFFETASAMNWYNNTLFIITADHTGSAEKTFYGNRVGMYQIPIVFFKPGSNLKGKNDKIIQQVDILPTVLDYMNYDKSFFSFGESAFDTTANHFAINYINEVYQVFDDEFMLQADKEKPLALYHYKTDSLLQYNLLKKEKHIKIKLDLKLKAIIQTYNQSLIKNRQIVK